MSLIFPVKDIETYTEDMAEEYQEPPDKKIKILNNSEIETFNSIILKVKTSSSNLEPVIHENFNKPILLDKCYVATIKNPKDISKIITRLNEKLPLKEFQHLKRVRNKKVLLCPFLTMNTTIEQYLENINEDLKDVFEDFMVIEVPSSAPLVRSQFEEANKIWPCNFHPNKYFEKLVSGIFFNGKELDTHKKFMALVFEVAKYYLKGEEEIFNELNVAAVVDPVTQSVVAIAVDDAEHPVKHATMLAIDNVSATQNGGAWINIKNNETDVKLRGINTELHEYLIDNFGDIKLGARKFDPKNNLVLNNDEDKVKDGPYLCTGYNIYMIREPCIMCAMALVHARIKKVFFCYDNLDNGALKSKVRLHTLASLNHHYEVFTGFL